jgi:hypothetical protein
MACLACREKHLKCDGRMPICTRCAESRCDCVFVRSRRGYRGRKNKQAVSQTVWPSPATSGPSQDSVLYGSENSSISVGAYLSTADGEGRQSADRTYVSNTQCGSTDYNSMIDIYYQHVHPAHPIILPQKFYIQNRRIFPDHLKNVMYFMASHYSSEDPDLFKQKAQLVFSPDIPDDGFKVQALLLFTLASYARFERDVGTKALMEAIDLCLRIDLDSNTFGSEQGYVFQESWRRTWWELYTITGMISLISGVNFRVRRPDDLLLPGHCDDYNAGRVAQSRDMQEMRQRFFTEGDVRWSSFAYKVEAMRILSSILENDNGSRLLTTTQVEAAGASISGFLLSLPEDKRHPWKEDGEFDEVMSCALMIIHLAGICLHFPRSGLASKSSFETVCGNDRDGRLETEDYRIHKAAAIKAANGLSKLLSSRTSLKSLTPCFSCAIAFAAAVHLSAWQPQNLSESQYSEHIQLELTALNTIGEIWPIARVVKGQVAQFARQIKGSGLRTTEAASLESSSSRPNIDLDQECEPWLQNLMSHDLDISSEDALFNFAYE